MRSIPLVRTIIVACVALPMAAAAQRPAPAPTEPPPARRTKGKTVGSTVTPSAAQVFSSSPRSVVGGTSRNG